MSAATLSPTGKSILSHLDACEDELRETAIPVTDQAWADLDRTRIALLDQQ